MNMLSLVLITSTLFVFNNVANDMPRKADRAYAIIIEAGAKLLEFDIIRESLDIQQKHLVEVTDKETFRSSVGKSISVMVPIENLAPSFDELVTAFITLQNDLRNDSATDFDKQSIALRGLLSVLETPEILHVLLPRICNGYQESLAYEPTANFIRAVQSIANYQFFPEYCKADNPKVLDDQKLSNSGILFYGIVKQAVINLFRDIAKEPISFHVSKEREKNKGTRDATDSVICTCINGFNAVLETNGKEPLDLEMQALRSKAGNICFVSKDLMDWNHSYDDDRGLFELRELNEEWRSINTKFDQAYQKLIREKYSILLDAPGGSKDPNIVAANRALTEEFLPTRKIYLGYLDELKNKRHMHFTSVSHAINKVAKLVGAAAVVDKPGPVRRLENTDDKHVDPQYDITSLVISMLNKEYLYRRDTERSKNK